MERRVYRCTPGIFGKLQLETEALPDPGPREIQISVRAIGLNFADVFCVLGLYKAAPRGELIPGLEYAGVISKTGSDVQNFKIGDKVIGVTRFGGYATTLNVDAHFVRALPDTWSFEEGAAYLVNLLTAYYGLVKLGRLTKGEAVVLQSAAGGVGLAALAIAKKFQCRVIGIVGNELKVSFCKERGCEAVAVRSRNLKRDLRKILGTRGIDVVMEAQGGSVFKILFSLLAPEGRMIVYGFSRYLPASTLGYLKLIPKYFLRPRVDVEQLNNRSVSAFNLIYLFDKAEHLVGMLTEAEKLGIGKPPVGRAYPFEKLPQALAALRGGSTTGKVVVTVHER